MPSPLSVALRERVVAAAVAGASCHRAAARFGVSVSSASRWSQRTHQEGCVAPKPMGDDHTSKRVEAHAELILATSERDQLSVTCRGDDGTTGLTHGCTNPVGVVALGQVVCIFA